MGNLHPSLTSFFFSLFNRTNEVGTQTIAPVRGGMSASVTISPSSMVVSVVTWSLCGRTGGVWHGAMPSVDVTVLLGISSAGSMSSCFMISSASMAWPGESEPGVAVRRPKGFDLDGYSLSQSVSVDLSPSYQFSLLVRKSWRLERRLSPAAWCAVGCLWPRSFPVYHWV